MQNEPSGEYYDYTKTMKPERPWLVDYHQSLVYKTMNAYKDENGDLKEVHMTFQQTMDLIERFHNMSLGMPQVVYLTGWQYNGHDSKYPAWEEVNEALKRPEDENGLQSLRWLMQEARKRFDARVSLHINMTDAYPDSPYWDEYVEKDIVAKDKDGKPIPGREWGGVTSYCLSYTEEWKKGLAQRRIDKLIDMLPELVDNGTIHIDAFLGARWPDWKEPISPYLGYDKATEAATMRKLYRYWRDKGIDVTSEWAFGVRDDRYVGLQPWAWHQEDKLEDLPDSLYCSTKWVGCDMWFIEDLENPPHAWEKFFLEIVPWHYKNNPGFDENLKVVDGSDVCVPALWCDETTAIAYSQDGCENKTWKLAEEWDSEDSAALAKITYQGLEPIGSVDVKDGRVTVSIEPNEAVAITVG